MLKSLEVKNVYENLLDFEHCTQEVIVRTLKSIYFV